MSIYIMSCVWKRYPIGGGEMLLALAMADHASDDGTKVYPSIKHLSQKTRQSERTIQYQLRRMEESGWLILVNSGNGGRNQCREYRINADWINGAEIAPPQKGATDDIKGAIHDTKGATDDIKGAITVAPASNHQEPPITIIKTIKKQKAVPAALVVTLPDWLPESSWNDWVEHRIDVKAPLTQKAANLSIAKLAKLREAGSDPVEVINASILSGKWTDLYPIKVDQKPGAKPSYPQKFDPTAYVNQGPSHDAAAANANRTDDANTIDVEAKFVEPAPGSEGR